MFPQQSVAKKLFILYMKTRDVVSAEGSCFTVIEKAEKGVQSMFLKKACLHSNITNHSTHTYIILFLYFTPFAVFAVLYNG